MLNIVFIVTRRHSVVVCDKCISCLSVHILLLDSIAAAPGLASYVELLVRKHDTQFNVSLCL